MKENSEACRVFSGLFQVFGLIFSYHASTILFKIFMRENFGTIYVIMASRDNYLVRGRALKHLLEFSEYL